MDKENKTTQKTAVKITKSDVLKLSGALGEILYGDMTSDGAMNFMKATIEIQNAAKSVENEQNKIIEGFRTDEYKALSEKVNSKTASEKEIERFNDLNRVAVPKSNEMLEKLFKEEVELDISLISEDDFNKLREANKSKITNGGFVVIYTYLCQ